MVEMAERYQIMGVVNVTNDSFSDGGKYIEVDAAVEHALRLVEEGADILDIGGESTRPGAKLVSPAEEQDRVIPVIEKLVKEGISVPISIDTRNSETMETSINAGVNIVNDISALRHDDNSLVVVREYKVPIILMHMQGTPEIMQSKPQYDDVVGEVKAFLQERVQACEAVGISKDKITLDVGIGFGKSLEDNLTLINNLWQFHDLGCDLLLGTSRKSFIDKICPDTPVDERLGGSIASAIKGIEQSVKLFRVHDVRQTKQAFDVWLA